MSVSLQESTAGSSSKSQHRRSSRRNPLIMSEEKDSDVEMDIAKENKVPRTPKSNNNVEKQFESPSVVKSNSLLQTPRRSSRKSVKPVQEYEDIVSCKRQLRSISKVGDEINNDKEEEGTNTEEQQPRWTPAKVGRVSRKRGRKSRKTVGDKNKSKLKNSSDNEDTNDVKEYVQNNVVIKSQDDNIKEADNINEISNNVEKSEKSEGIAEAQIAKNNDDTANVNDCVIVNHAEDEEMQPLQPADDENQSQLECTTDNEDTTEVKEHVQNNAVVQTQDENIQEADNINEISNNVEVFDKSEDIAEVQIATINDDTFNNSDCIIINQAEDEVEMQPLQLSDDENQSKLKNSKDSEDTTEVIEHIQNKVIQSQDENIQEADNINVIANNGEKSEKSEECKTEVQIVIINDETFDGSEEDEEEMQPLQFSDEESSTSPAPKNPRIILTTDKGLDQSLNVTAPLSDGTPKRYSNTAKRMPTPYRKNSDITEIDDDIDEKCTTKEPPITIELTKMEPKEAVLRSIRKRSFSVCIGGTEAEKRKNVTFYSPANTTAILEDLDVRMVESVKKNPILKPATTGTFITQRRKRSLSFDEAMINKSKLRTQTPSKMGVTPQKIKPVRTKLPNFAAIHQRTFEKMENLVDHVNRKAERAKVLTNSATKDRVASAQKTVKAHHASSTATYPEKSKAVKCLNLQPTVNFTFSLHNSTAMYKAFETAHKELNGSKLPIPRIGVCKPLVTAETTPKENREVKLPNPRLGIIKPHTITVGSNIKNKQITPAKTALKPTQTRQVARPAFNLSTTSHANNVKSSNTNAVQIASGAVTKTNTLTTNTTVAPTMSVDEKMASRRQRHMDMFKGRAANARTTPGTAEKRFGQLIRGVRSNRRFELQMAHRKNMEH